MHHGFPVFNHVGNTGRHTHIIFKHEKLARFSSNNIYTRDMSIDIAGRCKIHHLRHKRIIIINQGGRDNPGTDNFLRMIDVV